MIVLNLQKNIAQKAKLYRYKNVFRFQIWKIGEFFCNFAPRKSNKQFVEH